MSAKSAGGHHDALEGVLRGKDDVCSSRAPSLLKTTSVTCWYSPSGLPLSSEMVWTLTALAKGVGVARVGKLALALAHLLNDGLGGEAARGRSRVEGAEA